MRREAALAAAPARLAAAGAIARRAGDDRRPAGVAGRRREDVLGRTGGQGTRVNRLDDAGTRDVRTIPVVERTAAVEAAVAAFAVRRRLPTAARRLCRRALAKVRVLARRSVGEAVIPGLLERSHRRLPAVRRHRWRRRDLVVAELFMMVVSVAVVVVVVAVSAAVVGVVVVMVIVVQAVVVSMVQAVMVIVTEVAAAAPTAASGRLTLLAVRQARLDERRLVRLRRQPIVRPTARIEGRIARRKDPLGTLILNLVIRHLSVTCSCS